MPDEQVAAVAAQRVPTGQEQLVEDRPVVREQGGVVAPERIEYPGRNGYRAVGVYQFTLRSSPKSAAKHSRARPSSIRPMVRVTVSGASACPSGWSRRRPAGLSAS